MRLITKQLWLALSMMSVVVVEVVPAAADISIIGLIRKDEMCLKMSRMRI